MPLDAAELSSISSLLRQLSQRVGAMGEAAARGDEEDVANELFGVERALSGAERKLGRLVARHS